MDQQLLSASDDPLFNSQKNYQKHFKDIRTILGYLVDNVGIISTNKLIDEKKVFDEKDPELGIIFEALMNKYLTSSKTKEEKVKFILRKSFKFLKEKMEKTDVTSKKEIDK